MHFCQDEAAAIVGLFGTIGVACRYCWYRVSGMFRRPKMETKELGTLGECDHDHNRT